MSYPMWNEAKTGILVDRGNGILRFLEGGAEFDALKGTAADWHEAEVSKPAMPTAEEVRIARHEAFKSTADPVFLKWQRGEATEQDWLDAVQSVRSSHPYPE